MQNQSMGVAEWVIAHQDVKEMTRRAILQGERLLHFQPDHPDADSIRQDLVDLRREFYLTYGETVD